jgi:hypothetical protein
VLHGVIVHLYAGFISLKIVNLRQLVVYVDVSFFSSLFFFITPAKDGYAVEDHLTATNQKYQLGSS